MAPADILLDQQVLARRHRINSLQSIILLASQLGLLALTGWIVAGGAGLLGLLLGGIIAFLFAPRLQTGVALKMLGVRLLSSDQAPQLAEAVAIMARRAGLHSEPRLGFRPSNEVNAFTIGHHDDAVIVVTEGLLHVLDGRELAGVLAHEVSHIAGDDINVMALADLAMRLTGTMGRLGVFFLILSLPAAMAGAPIPSFALITILVIAPLASALVQLALSRTREYEADANAALIIGDPMGLASALTRMSQLRGDAWERLLLPGRRSVEPSVLRSHPPTRDRVRRLAEMVKPGAKPSPLEIADMGRGWSRRPTGFPSPRASRWRISGWW